MGTRRVTAIEVFTKGSVVFSWQMERHMIVKSAVKCLFQSTSNGNNVGVHHTIHGIYVLTASEMPLSRTRRCASNPDVTGSEH